MIKIASLFNYALLLSAFTVLSACSEATPPNLSKTSNLLQPARSVGCGIAQFGTSNFVAMKLNVSNQSRTFHLYVPKTYNPNLAYPLIFRWHGSGGNGLSGGLGIESSMQDEAIIISADGLNNFWDVFSAESADLRFFDQMLVNISKQYCINRQRIFSVGFSVGGTFSNTLACQRSEVLRGSAAVAGGLFVKNCKGKVATWLLHDADDEAVPINMGKAVRKRAVKANGCSTDTVDAGIGCVQYLGCDTAPVVWCETKGFNHNARGDYAPAQVWQFFQTLQ